jgi:hypothetical protein
MKIKYSIHSSDSNQLYLDFWPIISEIWQKHFNIIPVLIFIDNGEEKDISSDYGSVIKIKKIDNISVISQTQIVRLWATTLFPDDVSIISDIDMIPISRNYFIDSISEIEEQDYVHLYPSPRNYPRIPICYHVALGKVYKDVLNIDTEWEVFLKKVINYGTEHLNINESSFWFIDEIYSTNKILNYTGQYKLNLKNRKSGILDRRIDRSNWIYSNYLLKTNYYFDAHLNRPLHKFNHQIINFKNSILSRKFQHNYYLFEYINIFSIIIMKSINRIVLLLKIYLK